MQQKLQFTHTGYNDNLFNIVTHFYGVDLNNSQISACALNILRANNNTEDYRNPFHGWRGYNITTNALYEPLRPNAFFFIPSAEYNYEPEPSITKLINTRGMGDCCTLAKYCESGMSLPHLAAAMQVRESYVDLLTGTTLLTVEKYTEQVKETAERTKEAIEELDGIGQRYSVAAGRAKHAIKLEFKEKYTEFSADFSARINKIAHSVSDDRKILLSSRRLLKNFNASHAYSLISSSESQIISRNLRYVKIFNRSCPIVELSLGAAKVYNAYEKGENWHRELAAEAGGFAVGSVGGAFGGFAVGAIAVAIGVTPAGWVIFLGGVIAGAVGSYYGEKKSTEAYDKGYFNNIGYHPDLDRTHLPYMLMPEIYPI